MKLEYERDKSDEIEPITLFFVADHGRYEVDAGMWSTYLWPVGKKTREVQVRIIRPTGFFDKLFGGAKKLYIRIKTTIDGAPCKAWLWSHDDGRTWGMVKKLPTNTFEVLDTLVFEV
jgi:hypothetical protein